MEQFVSVPPVDPGDARFLADPYPSYARLRAAAPLASVADDVWMLSRYDDVVRASAVDTLSNDFTQFNGYTAFMAASGGPDSPEVRLQRFWVSQLDPPEHTRLRRVIGKAINLRVRSIEPVIQRIVEERLADCLGERPHDLVTDFAHRVSIGVIHEVLGLPEEDEVTLQRWSLERAVAVRPQRTPETNRESNGGAEGLAEYFGSLLRRRDRLRPGLLSDLAAALDAGELRTVEEFIGTGTLLVAAGHEAVANLLANSLHALSTEGVSLPGPKEPFDGLAAELARLTSPIQFTPRITTTDTRVLHDGPIVPAGNLILLGLGSANHDPDRFLNPDALVPGRHPNPHVAFGGGRHGCPGWRIGMLELEATLRALAEHRVTVTVAGPAVWQSDLLLRGLRRCDVLFTSPASPRQSHQR